VHQIKARLARESGIEDWRLHDLRRTLRSGLAELGVSYEIAERVIGHTMPQLERTYNVFTYREDTTLGAERPSVTTTVRCRAHVSKALRFSRIQAGALARKSAHASQLVRGKNPFPGPLNLTALGAGGGVGLDELALDAIARRSLKITLPCSTSGAG
jgi:hypothetical protein